MPLYEYKCESCAHRFERIQKFSDPPIESCPQCGSAVRKLLSSPAIQFKGSGFYITDYPKGEKSKKGEKSESGESGKSGEGKSEVKTESKTESKSEKSSSKPE